MRIMRLKKCTIPLKHHKSSSAVFKYLSNHKGNIFLPNIPSISTASSLKLQVFLPNNSPIKKYALRIKNSWKTMKDHKKATLLATTDKRPRLIWIIKIEKRSIQQSNTMQNLSYKTWLDQWKWETSQVLNPWFFDNLFYSAIKTSSLLFLIIITRDIWSFFIINYLNWMKVSGKGSTSKESADVHDTMDSIPRHSPKKIIQKTIKHNYQQLTAIPSVSFSHNIRHLYLSHNHITSLRGI